MSRTWCVDCGADTLPAEWGGQGEYYMVHDELWAKAGMAPNGGMLCIGCLERRIRRRLRPGDFIDAPINDPKVRPGRKAWTHRTRRLRDRLLGRGLPVHDPRQGRLFEVEA